MSGPNGAQVIVVRDADALAEEAARRFGQASRDAIDRRGCFTVALAGGSTPEKAYRCLTEPLYRESEDWSRTYVFFGDERFVPPEDERSNYGLAERTLLRHVPIPADHVFRVDTTGLPTADDAARAYAETLRTVIGAEDIAPPVLDLVLLGLGDDGHTASLFPGKPSLSVTDAWVVASPPGVLPPPVERVTLTFPVLNAARQVVFLITGAKKAQIVRELVAGGPKAQEYPAANVRPASGSLTYLLDADAAGLLSR
jgi:6-phosphogluconolactonase